MRTKKIDLVVKSGFGYRDRRGKGRVTCLQVPLGSPLEAPLRQWDAPLDENGDPFCCNQEMQHPRQDYRPRQRHHVLRPDDNHKTSKELITRATALLLSTASGLLTGALWCHGFHRYHAYRLPAQENQNLLPQRSPLGAVATFATSKTWYGERWSCGIVGLIGLESRLSFPWMRHSSRCDSYMITWLMKRLFHSSQCAEVMRTVIDLRSDKYQ